MGTTKTHPKWSATITIRSKGGHDETVTADAPDYDTLDAMKKAAVFEATQWLRLGLGTDAVVTVFKQLAKDPKPVRDRTFYVYRDERTGQFHYQA